MGSAENEILLDYLAEVARVRATGASTSETSCYGALQGALNARGDGVTALRQHDGPARGLLIVVAVFVLMGLAHDIFFRRTFWFICGLLLVDPARLAQAREEGPRP